MRRYAIKYHRGLLIAFLGALLVPATTSAQQFGYSFTDMGVISNAPRGYSALINNSGQIVLNVAFRPNVTFPFVRVYENGGTHSLPGLGTGHGAAAVGGLNDSGDMVGVAFDGGFGGSAFPTTTAAKWSASDVGTLATLGFDTSNDGTVAFSTNARINNAGHILRGSEFYDGSSIASIGFSGIALNDNDEVIGPSGNSFARWSSASGVQSIPSFYAGLTTTARDINNGGLVVGDAIAPGGAAHAFYFDGAYHDLNSLVGGTTSKALFVNNNGAIVGDSDRGPWLYDAGHMYLLRNYLPGAYGNGGWNDVSIGQTARDFKGVLGINDLGQIILGGFDFGHGDELLYSFAPRLDPGARAFAITGQSRSITTFGQTWDSENFLDWRVDNATAWQQSKIADQSIVAEGFAYGLVGPSSSLFDMTFTLTKPGAVFLKSFGDVQLLSNGLPLGGTEAGSATYTETAFVLPAGSYQIKGVADVAQGVEGRFSLVLTVPEPSTLGMTLIGAALMLVIARRRTRP
jgi:hypothetical protein